MSYSTDEDPYEYSATEDQWRKVKQDKKKRHRPRRCSACHQNVEPDGYGEWVHSNTMLYGEYDAKNELTHVAFAR